MRIRMFVLIGAFLLSACGDEAPVAQPATSVGTTDGGTGRTCVDEDEDGFGPNCALGRDCDDGDPEETDLCYRCASPNQDCPCEAGTEPVWCNPPDEHVEGGLIVCSEGTRYCRDEFWSDCERIEQYAMFVRN